MNKKFLYLYRVPVLLSATLMVALIALNSVREPLDLTQIILGALVGAFVLDMEYVLYAYVFEPKNDFSVTLKAFLNHWDLSNAILFINYHKKEIKDKSLNSAIFQIVIALASIFIVMAAPNLLIKALVLSVFAHSLYRLAEAYFNNELDDWFWAFKSKPTRTGVWAYSLVLLVIFSYCVSIF